MYNPSGLLGLKPLLKELRIKVREAKKNLERSKKYHLYLVKHKANLEKILDEYGRKHNPSSALF